MRGLSVAVCGGGLGGGVSTEIEGFCFGVNDKGDGGGFEGVSVEGAAGAFEGVFIAEGVGVEACGADPPT